MVELTRYGISTERPTRPPIIGGMFGLSHLPMPDSDGSIPAFLSGKVVFLVNASSAIWLLAKRLSPSHVWLPSFLCGSVLRAIDTSTTMIRFYEVDYDLNIPSSEWLDRIQPGDVVILIDYFGFPGDVAWITRIKQRGAWVLEDATQALLSSRVGQPADFVVFSPRKSVGVPDGGILIVNCEMDLSNVRLEKPPAQWWLKALSASVLRREFDIYGGSRYWFELFQEVEIGRPIGAYAMSELSWTLLRCSFDYSTIAQRRVDNYRLLLNKLGDIALFAHLPEKVVPLGFPIRVKHRDDLRQVLFDNQIYPPVHWPVQGIVPQEFSDSHRLADEIMTLPCDQRYDREDMERMASIILKELRR